MANSFLAASALSTNALVNDAVDEVATSILAQLNGETPTIVIVFGGVAFDQTKLFERFQSHFDAPIVGGSSQGASVQGQTVERPRFVCAAAITGATVRIATVDTLSGDPGAIGRSLGADLGERPSIDHTTLLFYDSLGGVDAQALTDGLGEQGYNKVWGMAAGQPWGKIVRTFQYLGDRIAETGAVVCVIEGLRPIGELTHGADSIGLELEVTKSSGNVVFELDGRPALDVWCEQLGVSPDRHVDNISNWALGLKAPDNSEYEGLITRSPFLLNVDDKTLVFSASIPEGSVVQVCTRVKDKVYDGGVAMGDRLAEKVKEFKPVLALGFECGARPAPFLGSELAADEVNKIQSALGDLPWCGGYAWGEIAPVGSKTYFHNFTFPLCVLGSD